jgi:hypothetical protein
MHCFTIVKLITLNSYEKNSSNEGVTGMDDKKCIKISNKCSCSIGISTCDFLEMALRLVIYVASVISASFETLASLESMTII